MTNDAFSFCNDTHSFMVGKRMFLFPRASFPCDGSVVLVNISLCSAILKQQQLIKSSHRHGEICNVDKGSVNIHNRSTSNASFMINKSVGPICKLDNNLIISAKEVSTQTAAFSPTGSTYDTTIVITINDSAN